MGQTNARVEESRGAQDPDGDDGGSCQDDDPEAAGAGDAEAVLIQAYHVVMVFFMSCLVLVRNREKYIHTLIPVIRLLRHAAGQGLEGGPPGAGLSPTRSQ
jgi:hypothetical protein